MRVVGFVIYFVAAAFVLVEAVRCDDNSKRRAQEQWRYGDIVKTVNAVN